MRSGGPSAPARIRRGIDCSLVQGLQRLRRVVLRAQRARRRILDVVDENGALQRIASSQALPQLWEVHKSQPNGKRAHTHPIIEAQP
jgi:hypothetical protein